MPEITRSGFCGSNLCSATITQSAGVPSTAQCRSATRWHTMGWRSVSDCAAPLRSVLGATMLTSARSASASAKAHNPGALYPSSLVSRICVIPGLRLREIHQALHLNRDEEIRMVGAPGFEPGTSRTPSVRATRLRYAPTKLDPAESRDREERREAVPAQNQGYHLRSSSVKKARSESRKSSSILRLR